MNKTTVQEEYMKAQKEKRQPHCPYCGKPLEITQTQYSDITWKWNDKKKRYTKYEDGEAEKPYCMYCESRDWDFVDYDLLFY